MFAVVWISIVLSEMETSRLGTMICKDQFNPPAPLNPRSNRFSTDGVWTGKVSISLWFFNNLIGRRDLGNGFDDEFGDALGRL